MSVCLSCQAGIRWAITDTGRLVPLDTDTNADGNIELTGRTATDRGGRPLPECRVIPDGQQPMSDATRYVHHLATCRGPR